jgi:hypothetical protein
MASKDKIKKNCSLKTHYINPNVEFHAQNTQTSISFYQMMINDLKSFLVADPARTNKYVIYDVMPRLDPELGVALQMITFSVLNSYQGPALKEGYKPSREDFLSDIENILAEIKFSTNLPEIVRGLVKNGDVVWRLFRRGASSTIDKVELLPTYAITIIDNDFEKDPENNKVIRKRENYLVGERSKDQIKKPSLQPVIQTSQGTPTTEVAAVPQKVGEARVRIPADEVLHFSMMSQGNYQKDIFGRDTYGIWGISPLESLVFVLKMKLALNLDYLRWSRTGMPRWDAALDLTEVMNLMNYQGSNQERLKQARDMANDIFEEFRKKLYYTDNDSNSPTFGQELPIETDHMWIHGTNVTVEQKGGQSEAPVHYLEVIKKCDMSICSALGVPLSLFGYESGSTYAIGYITQQFMTSIGGGLLKCIESTVEDFLRAEMKARKMDFTEADFDNLILKYKVNDTETLKAELEVKKLQISLAGEAYDKGIVTKNEAREILGLPPVEGGDEFKEPPANPLEGLLGAGPGEQKSPQGKQQDKEEGKEKEPKAGEQSEWMRHMTDEELHGPHIHHHAEAKVTGEEATREEVTGAKASPLEPVELKLETDLLKEYNQAVQQFANGAIKLLDGITDQKPEETAAGIL